MSSNPATGSTAKKESQAFKVIKFLVSEVYSEREIENLFETLEARGAYIERLTTGPAWHELYVPADVGWEPYFSVLEKCESIRSVSNMIKRKYVIQLGPED